MLQLLINTTQVMREEYLNKLDKAAVVMENRVKALTNEKKVQAQELDKCSQDKDSLVEGIKSLTMKYDEALDQNKRLSQRLDKLLEQLQRKQPELSEAEEAMKRELEGVLEALDSFRNRINQIQSKFSYQREIARVEEDIQSQPLLPLRDLNTTRDRSVSLSSSSCSIISTATSPSKHQIRTIRKILENQGNSIHHLLQTVNHLKQEANLGE
jgi:prefoldin subunit 5